MKAEPRTVAGGFTLIELMISIAVAVLMLTLGVPSFRNMILDNRLATEVNVVVAELNLARSEAIARNTLVIVKPLSGTEWHKGWRSFVDFNKNGVFDKDETELRQHEALNSGIAIAYSGTGATFTGTGMLPEYGKGGPSEFTFTFCDERGSGKARGLTLAVNGRLRVARDAKLTCS